MALGKKTIWTVEMDNFLKSNYQTLTNQQLATALGLKLTVTRNRLSQLGLKRFEMEYFTKEQLDYLLANYKTTGNVRIANYLNANLPKNKPWTENHIVKKMGYLGLKRSEEELELINSYESGPQGLRFTILKNSSSINLHPSWVAQRIAWRDKALQAEILKHPELIDLKKNQILLNRKIKQNGKQQTSKP